VIDTLNALHRFEPLDGSGVPEGDMGTMFFDPKRRLMPILAFASPFEAREPVVAYLKALLPALRQAHVFRFENLAPVPGGGGGLRMFPSEDEEAAALFGAGRIRMPFPVCWFEFTLSDVLWALLIETVDGKLSIHEFLQMDASMRAIKTTCFSLAVTPKGAAEGEAGPAYLHEVVDPLGQHGRVCENYASLNPDDPDAWKDSIALRRYGIHLMSVLASNGRTIDTVKPSLIANRRRSDKGLSRLPDVHVVSATGRSVASVARW
jgi:hypothetical protein